MKTRLLALAFSFICIAAAAQQEVHTSYDVLKVVTTPNGLAALLMWTKGSENVSYFIVERSNHGIDFSRCVIVFTSEDPTLLEYKFRDKIASASQRLVYRLALVSDQKHISYLSAKTLIATENL